MIELLTEADGLIQQRDKGCKQVTDDLLMMGPLSLRHLLDFLSHLEGLTIPVARSAEVMESLGAAICVVGFLSGTFWADRHRRGRGASFFISAPRNFGNI